MHDMFDLIINIIGTLCLGMSIKRHGLACHYKSLHTMTLILSVIFVNQNYDIQLKRHSLLVIFQSNNLTMTII